jgi:hypothetical protein
LVEATFGTHHQDLALYSLAADPEELVNLVGRPEYKEVADQMRKELEKRIAANEEPPVGIKAITYYA